MINKNISRELQEAKREVSSLEQNLILARERLSLAEVAYKLREDREREAQKLGGFK